jgi:hypothetical protein
MLAVLLEHRGICLDCLAEKVKLSLDEVMAGLRRTQGTALLAFVTRACVVCSRKSLVSYVRDSAVVHGPGALADSGKAEAVDDDHTDCADVEVRPIGSRQDDPEDGACAMSVSRLGQRSSTVTSGAFGESAGRHSNDGFRGDHRSTAPAADLPELHGRTLVLQAEDDVLDPAPRPEAALDRRDLQHVGMILKLADAQGTGESHA